jgi:hypothetical protein
MRAEDWMDRISPERSAEIKEVQKPSVGKALAQSMH